jgi:RsiW-degrading membrane proteinase PrsW (M82 family)
MTQWHYLVGSVTHGPIAEPDFRALIDAGTIGPNTLVWTAGMTDWAPLSACGAVRGAAAPPTSSTAGGTASSTPRATPPAARGFAENFSDRIGQIAGTDTVRLEHVGGLFSEVMRRHDERALEEVFAAGLASTTPTLDRIDASHPTPWVYSRVLAFFGVAFLALWLGWNEYGNLNLLPGIILIGSFAFPLGAAIFFFECNVARNVPLFTVSKLFVWGGILGILLSLVGFEMTSKLGEVLGPPIAGIVEEPGKLAAVIFLVNAARFRWTLNGLAIGAAVGAGFAAFESAGYALTFLLVSESDDVMLSVIVLRGLLAPFAHVVWTAVAAGALWRVRRGRPFEWSMLGDRRFLAPMISVMVIHALWNSPLPSKLPFQLGYIALGVVAWTIAIGLLLGGLREIQQEQRAS